MGDRWKSVYFSRRARRQRGEIPQKLVPNEAGMVNSLEACPTMCTVEDRTHVSDTSGVDSGDLRILPMQFNSNDNNTFHHVMVSMKNDIQQACLRAFQKKRDELCEQQRLLEDEIACCEMNIQTLLRVEGEENWTRKVEMIIEALNSSCSSQVQMNLAPEEEDPSQTTKRRKLSEAVCTSTTHASEVPANATAQGADFRYTSDSCLKSKPVEAWESTTSPMPN